MNPAALRTMLVIGGVLGVFLLTGLRQLQIEPSHRRPNTFGPGWVCERGYYKDNDRCLPIKVPEHGQLNFLGNDWECMAGYIKQGSFCKSFRIPMNAGLDTIGSWWRCNHGFQQVGDECVAIKLPPLARLDSTGNDWECKDGYKRVNDRCEPMTPEEKMALLRKKQMELKYKQAAARKADPYSGPSIPRPPCYAAYNKCTSACAATVYDRDTGQAVGGLFTNQCDAACMQGRLLCEGGDAGADCDSFAQSCMDNCQFILVDKAVGRNVRDLNGGSVCESACNSGKARCESIRRGQR